MRTLFLSDLHLGPGGTYDIFAAQGGQLVELLDRFTDAPTRVVLNGDAVDFLLNDDPLELRVEQAVAQAKAIVSNPVTAAVFQALGRVLAAGGEVLVTIGNHDVEIALAEVQAVLRGALGQPDAAAARLRFFRGDQPLILEEGGARVLVTHGQHDDVFNRVDWSTLPGPGAPVRQNGTFHHPPGSTLVKELLNPLKRDFRMRFMDLLKPDFQGAVLTGLAVDPAAVRVAWSRGTASLLYQLFKATGGPNTFVDEADAELDLGLEARLKEAGLTPEELESLRQTLDPEAADAGADQRGPVAFGDDGGDWMLASAVRKLGRSGLERYARRLQGRAGDESVAYFSTTPSDAEWAEVQRLRQKFKADAVIIGHTHAARWKVAEDVVFLNTGTWIGLMRLPFFDYGDGGDTVAWEEYIEELRDNPQLKPELCRKVRVETRFTAGLLEEGAQGPVLSLVELTPEGLRTLGSAPLPRSAG